MAGEPVKLIAFDIATTCGWVVRRPAGNEPLCGHFTVTHQGDDVEWAYVQAEKNIMDLLRVHQPTVAAFEAPLPRGSKNFHLKEDSAKATRKILGLVAVFGMVLRREGLTLRESRVQDSRGALCERNADKARVMQVCRMYGWTPKTYDESDAVAVWVYWMMHLDPEWRAWFSSRHMRSTSLFESAAR